MFNLVQQKRALKEQERQISAALGDRHILEYGYQYFDASYRRGAFTIVLSGKFLYHLADDGRLSELFACCYPDSYTPSPEEFAILLDGLFTQLQENRR